IRMFIDEAKIVGQLSHANIAPIYELGKLGDSHYIAMEFVWGKDLLQMMNRFRKLRRRMPPAMAAFLSSKMCEGLDYAHRKKDRNGQPLGIIHRDVSPQNVLISYEGQVKLIDFGIAKAASRSTKTQAGVLKGKFGYMSPEQVRGLPIDHRSDVFAAGTCLHEMLTGERLFAGESDFSTLEKVRNAEVPPPSRWVPDLPPALEQICMRALSRNAEQRWQTAADMHEAVVRFLSSQPSGFGATELSRWMKSAFAAELAAERQRNEQYARLGRPASVGASAPAPSAPEPGRAMSLLGPSAPSPAGAMAAPAPQAPKMAPARSLIADPPAPARSLIADPPAPARSLMADPPPPAAPRAPRPAAPTPMASPPRPQAPAPLAPAALAPAQQRLAALPRMMEDEPDDAEPTQGFDEETMVASPNALESLASGDGLEDLPGEPTVIFFQSEELDTREEPTMSEDLPSVLVASALAPPARGAAMLAPAPAPAAPPSVSSDEMPAESTMILDGDDLLTSQPGVASAPVAAAPPAAQAPAPASAAAVKRQRATLMGVGSSDLFALPGAPAPQPMAPMGPPPGPSAGGHPPMASPMPPPGRPDAWPAAPPAERADPVPVLQGRPLVVGPGPALPGVDPLARESVDPRPMAGMTGTVPAASSASFPMPVPAMVPERRHEPTMQLAAQKKSGGGRALALVAAVFVLLLAATAGAGGVYLWRRRSVPQLATLVVNTGALTGAIVRIDGNERGRTPLTLQGLTPGVHMLAVAADGHERHERMLDLQAGETTTVSVTLRARVDSPALATVPSPRPTPPAQPPPPLLDPPAVPAAAGGTAEVAPGTTTAAVAPTTAPTTAPPPPVPAPAPVALAPPAPVVAPAPAPVPAPPVVAPTPPPAGPTEAQERQAALEAQRAAASAEAARRAEAEREAAAQRAAAARAEREAAAQRAAAARAEREAAARQAAADRTERARALAEQRDAQRQARIEAQRRAAEARREAQQRAAAERPERPATPRPPAAEPQPAGFGTLVINTVPWARVFLDGRDTGRNTPIPNLRVRAGAHRLTFRTADGRSVSVSVTVGAGETVRVVRRL
ncbi:MAG: serine/threonine protein kinase, partial [Deltaproteobacteria bacterium]|nr:serine/threonine protein kinase [Deltaproteobacteria bacterium]